jgi:hypothetical protein
MLVRSLTSKNHLEAERKLVPRRERRSEDHTQKLRVDELDVIFY